MNLQFGVLRTFSCLYWMSVLHILSLNSAEPYNSKYILPVLPETPYTLNDVIILPENTDAVEATIISTLTSTVLATVNLTIEHGFRLGAGVVLQNGSVESGLNSFLSKENIAWFCEKRNPQYLSVRLFATGYSSGFFRLQIVTAYKASLVIELETGLLKLQPIDDYGNMFQILAGTDNFEETQDTYLLIQPSVSGNSITFCILCNEGGKMTYDHELFSQEINRTTNCTTKKVSVFDRLILNNISMLPGIEITSKYPVSILQGHRTNISYLVRDDGDFNTSSEPFSQISWHVIPPFNHRTNQYILIPSQDRRAVRLQIMSPVNTSVDFNTDTDFISLNLTANKPTDISLSVEPNDTLIAAGKDRFSLSCVRSDQINCDNNIFPFNIPDKNYSTSLNSENRSEMYKWIYISNNIKWLIMCPPDTDISLSCLNGTADIAEEIRINTSNLFLKIIYLTSSSSGFYKISFSVTLDICEISYFQTERFITSKKVKESKQRTLKPTSTSSFHKMLNSSANVSSVLTLVNTTLTHANNLNRNTTKAEIMQNRSASSVAAEEQLSLTSIKTSSFIKEKTTKPPVPYTLTTKNDSNKVHGKGSGNEKEVIDARSDTNKIFKAVVDILHSDDGNKNTLIISDKKQSNPPYRFDINDIYGHGDDGKNLVAIIASLLSAILAVGAIILIYLLKDVFSRRQQIRKTRIRPYVSYY